MKTIIQNYSNYNNYILFLNLHEIPQKPLTFLATSSISFFLSRVLKESTVLVFKKVPGVGRARGGWTGVLHTEREREKDNYL